MRREWKGGRLLEMTDEIESIVTSAVGENMEKNLWTSIIGGAAGCEDYVDCRCEPTILSSGWSIKQIRNSASDENDMGCWIEASIAFSVFFDMNQARRHPCQKYYELWG